MSSISFMSPPAQNALSPAPVMTTAKTSGSSPASTNASVSWLTVRRAIALRRCGRLIVIHAALPRTS